VEHENPPSIFGGSYFNIIRAIIFGFVLLTLTISVSNLFSKGKFLIKLVVISLVALEQALSKVLIFILISREKSLFYFYTV
ncbi:uncharacterized protein EV154DRAFT_533366, partial [Mucor mucedo]|uniref:uncharacterized protein n=1 Tax=Mucor mucedo TaxID=29922 RepID=UPI0022201C96